MNLGKCGELCTSCPHHGNDDYEVLKVKDFHSRVAPCGYWVHVWYGITRMAQLQSGEGCMLIDSVWTPCGYFSLRQVSPDKRVHHKVAPSGKQESRPHNRWTGSSIAMVCIWCRLQEAQLSLPNRPTPDWLDSRLLPTPHPTTSMREIPSSYWVHVWYGIARMAGLQSGEGSMTIDSVVWAQYTYVTDT